MLDAGGYEQLWVMVDVLSGARAEPDETCASIP